MPTAPVTTSERSGPRPVYSDQARAAILSQLGPALSALPDVTAAARWPLVEALLGFLPDVDTRAPLMTMRAHLDALGRILREEPGSPHLPEVDQAAARAYLRHLRGPGVLDVPVARLLPTLRLIDEDLDLRVVAADLARTRRDALTYRVAALDVAMFALREAARAADALEAERGVRVPWPPTLRDVADLSLRPLGSPAFEALRLLERAVLTADAQAREETDRAMWSGLARAALRAGQASSPLPWPWG